MKSKLILVAAVLLSIVLMPSLYTIVVDYKDADNISRGGEGHIAHAAEPKAGYIVPAPNPPRITPEAIIIDNVPLIHQMPRWPTGCEVVSIKMLAEFYGVNKTVDEWIDLMPRGDIHWLGGTRYGPSPKEKFAGNPYTLNSYGVYHQPIVKMLEPYFGDRLINMTGKPWGDYEDMILAGNPIAIWGTIENLPVVLRDTWVTPTGEEYQWRGNGHCMILVGFSKTHVLLNDPYTGSLRRFDREIFLQRWQDMGQQGIAIRPM